jgi:Flp pilus assembly protein TadG
MRHSSIRQKRGERGNALIEFAAVSIVIIPLFFGTVAIGINLGNMNESVQICRDAGHMYARGVDFSQAANQDILVQLASVTGMTTTGGNAVVTFSQVMQVYQADCNGAGLTSGCTNLNQYVFVNRLVVGNSSLRSSNYGTPVSSILDSEGNISAVNYMTQGSAVVTGTLSSELSAAGLTLNDGDVLYLTEFYYATPSLAFLAYGGATGASAGVYAKAYF